LDFFHASKGLGKITTEVAKAGKMNHNHKPLFKANNKGMVQI